MEAPRLHLAGCGQVLLAAGSARASLKIIAATGVGCLALSYAPSPVIPIIMKRWTTSYALVTSGWSCGLFLAFYCIAIKSTSGPDGRPP